MKKLRYLVVIMITILMQQSISAQPPGPTKPKAGTWFTISIPKSDNLNFTVTSSGAVELSSATDESAYWKLIPLPDKSYRIFNKKAGKFLTVRSNEVLEKLTLTDQPNDQARFWITQGSGMNSRYIFLRNASSKLYPMKDPDGTNALVQSTGNLHVAASFLSIRLTEKGPAQ